MKKLIRYLKQVLEIFQKHRLNASAAHAAFFIMLSFIPCIILLFSLLQFTSIEKTDVLVFVQNIVPTGMLTFVTGIVGEAYNKTATTVSVSALAALWSAGQGMMALTQGLQSIAEIKETRNYFAVRLRATLYTVVLHGPDIAGELEILQILQEGLGEEVPRPQVGDVLLREVELLDVADDLLQTGRDAEAAAVGAAPEEQIKVGDPVLVAVLEIAVGHGQLVEVTEHGQVQFAVGIHR